MTTSRNDGVGSPNDFDHYAEDFARRWREQFATMRATCPVAHTDAHGGFYAVSRYADVQSGLRNHKTFSSARDLAGSGWASDGGATIVPHAPTGT